MSVGIPRKRVENHLRHEVSTKVVTRKNRTIEFELFGSSLAMAIQTGYVD